MVEDHELVIDLAEHQVTRGGELIALQRKIFDLLVFFAENQGRLLTKNQILRGVWPETNVTDGSVKDSVKQLRSALGDDPSNPRFIVTERGVGYRFICPVALRDASASPVAPSDPDPAPDPLTPPQNVGSSLPKPLLWIGAGIAALAIIVSTVLYRAAGSDLVPAMEANMPYGLPSTPSIAILPFKALSDDREIEIIARGLADDMTISLARLPQLVVSARLAASDDSLKDLPPHEIAERVGVEYLLQGTVQGTSEALRISAGLIDAVAGRIVWSRQFDVAGSILFGTRDKIVLDTLVAMSITLDEGQRDRATTDTTNLQSWIASNEAYLEYLVFQPANNARARTLWQRALELDDRRAVPHAGIAFTYFQEAWRGWTANREAALTTALKHARIAVERDPNQALGYQALGSVLIAQGHVNDGIAAKRKAVELAPNDFAAIGGLATFLPAYGFETEAVSLFHRAVRLNPDPPAWVALWFGHALHADGQVDEAVEWLTKAATVAPKTAHVHARLAAALADQGRLDEARSSVETALELDPNLSAARISQLFVFASEGKSRWFSELLHAAGLPD
jgi:adenylate cyclase